MICLLLPNNQDIDDIYVSREDMNGAMHGDLVLVRPKVGLRERLKLKEK